MASGAPHPIPDDPTLAAVAIAMRDAGCWADVVDPEWRLVYSTDDFRLSMGSLQGLADVPLDVHYFGPEAAAARLAWSSGPNNPEHLALMFRLVGPWVLHDTPGGREVLRRRVAAEVRAGLDEIEPAEPPIAVTAVTRGMSIRRDAVNVLVTMLRLHDPGGSHAGTLLMFKPEPPISVFGAMAVGSDLGHLERVQRMARAGRRPAAVLFADLEASSPLSRRLPTGSYFTLGRRLARAADACVIDAGGIVGRHVGDGVVAFFPGETAGSESAAARACITAARSLRAAVVDVAGRTGLDDGEVVLRFGLHWGAMLYIGQVTTRARMEVTALGDEVNEAARIEACATGGLALASKALLERLDPADATALGLDPSRITYTPLSDLATATDKARRDAPAIAVCEV